MSCGWLHICSCLPILLSLSLVIHRTHCANAAVWRYGWTRMWVTNVMGHWCQWYSQYSFFHLFVRWHWRKTTSLPFLVPSLLLHTRVCVFVWFVCGCVWACICSLCGLLWMIESDCYCYLYCCYNTHHLFVLAESQLCGLFQIGCLCFTQFFHGICLFPFAISC